MLGSTASLLDQEAFLKNNTQRSRNGPYSAVFANSIPLLVSSHLLGECIQEVLFSYGAPQRQRKKFRDLRSNVTVSQLTTASIPSI